MIPFVIETIEYQRLKRRVTHLCKGAQLMLCKAGSRRLGEFSTVGSLMGFVAGRGLLIEGYFARLMYRSLYKMHEAALHGLVKVGLDTVARSIPRRTEPPVKLH